MVWNHAIQGFKKEDPPHGCVVIYLFTSMKKSSNRKKPQIRNSTKPRFPTEESVRESYFADQREDQETARMALAGVPIGTVAMVAASLSNLETSAEDCIKKAYEILELATFGQNFLARTLNHSSISYTGVVEAIKYNTEPPKDLTEEEIATHLKNIRINELLDASSSLYSFEQSLKEIIPKSGKSTDRLPLFRRWLMAKFNITDSEAGAKIGEWKERGLPADIFATALDSYSKWRKWQTSESAKIRNKKSQEAKKNRRKARPPVDQVTTEMMPIIREIQKTAKKRGRGLT